MTTKIKGSETGEGSFGRDVSATDVPGTKKEWNKPQVKFLGTIKDVSGAQTPLAQAANAKS